MVTKSNHPSTFNEHLDQKYGKQGTTSRTAFEESAIVNFIAELVRDARKRAGLTQEELAAKINTKRTYISRLERAASDIQLGTLKRIVEDGLGGRLHISIEL